MMTTTHISAFQRILDEKGVITDQTALAPHLEEWRGKFFGNTELMLAPKTTEEMSKVVSYCNDNRIPIVPQGGNTGLVGGSLPGLGDYKEIIVSTKRLTTAPIVDKENLSITAPAGCTVSELQEAADQNDLLFPLSLASEGSCTVGGIVSTNAGGVHVLRYGNTRALTLGVEAVLPTGEVYDNTHGLRKDNTGYALDQLLVGAEGTLGIVTAACFRLFSAEVSRHTLWLAVDSPSKAVSLLAEAQARTAGRVSVFELMPDLGLEFVLKHINGTRRPITSVAPWHILLEVSSSTKDPLLSETLEEWVADKLENSHISDGVLAMNEGQRQSFWHLRESLSEAQKHEGGSIKHDISIPVSRIADFIQETTGLLLQAFPGCRPTPFGHVGDGNLHFNVMQSQDGNREAFLSQWPAMNKLVHDQVVRFGGSISAEHGIGSLKKEELARTKSTQALRAMQAVKKALDPNGIMNPNVLFTNR